MLTFFNRKGTPVSKKRWRELYVDQTYSVVAAKQVGGLRIDCSWVGVSSTLESHPPMLYLVRVVNLHAKNGAPHTVEHSWHATEEEAEARYEELVRQVEAAAA